MCRVALKLVKCLFKCALKYFRKFFITEFIKIKIFEMRSFMFSAQLTTL
jgi:hypothetical protein